MHITLLNPFKRKASFLQKEPAEGYDIWAKSYDFQPGNLMLDFDEEIFSGLISKVNLREKFVADIGCGTGRHWNKIFSKEPALLEGFDVSAGMLRELKRKFPQANSYQIHDNCFTAVKDGTYDVVISTLTIAHIKNIKEALTSWCIILKPGGELLITDFHPVALSRGGKRTFKENSNTISITNYVHSIESIKTLLNELKMSITSEYERVIDEKVKHYYEEQNALQIYNRFIGVPMIYGLLIKKQA